MTQDCFDSLSTADVSRRLPKGIHVVGAGKSSAPKVEATVLRKRIRRQEDPSTQPTSWSYLYIQHMAAKAFQKWLETYNADETNPHKQPFFIHKSFRYSYKDKVNQQGVKKKLEPSVSGLVFLQGTVRGLQEFLANHFPQYHLVKDRCHDSLYQRLHHATFHERGERASRAGHLSSRFLREVRQGPRKAPRRHRSFRRLRGLHRPH